MSLTSARTGVPVDIRGAKGQNAVTINGIYEPTDEICSGWPVYRKRGDPNKWLEFFVASNKWYIKATTDKGRARGWMRVTADPATRPELCKSVCEVWDGSKWASQPTVSIVSAKQRREEDKKNGMERRLLSVPVDIRGAQGPSASSVNGVYEPTDDICGGWPVYRKKGDADKWLEYMATTNEWYVKPTADRGRAEGWMCIASDPPQRPELSRGVCEIWDGDRWMVQNTVTVMTAVCGFETLLDIHIYCAEESKALQQKVFDSLKRASGLLPIPTHKLEEAEAQLTGQLLDYDKKLVDLKAKRDIGKSASEAADNSAPPPKPVLLEYAGDAIK